MLNLIKRKLFKPTIINDVSVVEQPHKLTNKQVKIARDIYKRQGLTFSY